MGPPHQRTVNKVNLFNTCVGVNKVSEKFGNIKLINNNLLQHEDSTEHGRAPEIVGTSSICDVGQSRKAIPKLNHSGLRIGTWNFQGLCRDRKALEIGEVLAENHIDIIGGQESWELESSKIIESGCKWFGKPIWKVLKVSEERVAWIFGK